jgi:hypothetical protein
MQNMERETREIDGETEKEETEVGREYKLDGESTTELRKAVPTFNQRGSIRLSGSTARRRR